MELLQLEHFIELAEREHLTRTAEKLMISPPSLSASIARLEKNIGYPLFDKKGRNICLNENGKILYKYAKQVFASLTAAQHEIESANGVYQEKVSVAYTAPTLWIKAFQAFIGEHPDVWLTNMEVTLPVLYTVKCQLEHDLFITGDGDLPVSEFESEVILENDEPGVIVKKDHPLASRAWIDMIEAKDENFIALSKGYSSRKLFDDTCLAAGFIPNITVQCDYLLRSQMVEAGYGITFSTRLGYESSLLKNFAFVPIRRPLIQRKQCILWKRNCQLSPIAARFRDFIIDYYKKPLTAADK